ncbi:MAG TPA: hypothetical protein VNK49_01195 [Anaerolineales bacterium]|nr:hypothetical protein [Anaerolineales bacterium]
MLACQFIEWRVQPARLKFLARLDLLSAFPPVRAGVGKNILPRWFWLALLRTFLALIFEF